ncbi:hypothetical protein EDD37DRAFT_421696 [Exophiala viscosa]|uniref:uncharacterized protein n=1 Tax=Exophiala viscosa TaxID=2486360 RepID=UPI00219CF2A2|nr:hypothetical protein EDD37DRAFT_421696 [Exophiala viscosa]
MGQEGDPKDMLKHFVDLGWHHNALRVSASAAAQRAIVWFEHKLRLIQRRMSLTGTPMSNNHEALYQVFEWFVPGSLPDPDTMRQRFPFQDGSSPTAPRHKERANGNQETLPTILTSTMVSSSLGRKFAPVQFTDNQLLGVRETTRDEDHRAVRVHCHNKLELCVAIRSGLETARKVLDEHDSPLIAEELGEHNDAVTKLVNEENLLCRELPRLVTMTLAAAHQLLSEAYGSALATLLKQMIPAGRPEPFEKSGAKYLQ